MSSVTVCVRFRPMSSREEAQAGEGACVKPLDEESFLFRAEKEEEQVFCFDRVFYEDSKQVDVYEFLAQPIVQDTMNGINGTIITYGQTGAGKTYTMEGPSIGDCDDDEKGLLPRVVEGLFKSIKSAPNTDIYIVKLSMVEIYMEKVRDLFDLTKDNMQIKEGKTQGIYLSGVTEFCVMNAEEALKCLARGIANRAVGETQMNLSSSRSHCIYIFFIQRESQNDLRLKTGKLVLVDLAGSEKVEKTGAEGRVLEEAKTINKSLSALGNVINALTTGRVNHIPYRDSKLTRILQDALGGNSRCALLCCCSPSNSNMPESLSTIRFGTRSKLLKAPIRATPYADEEEEATPSRIRNISCDQILEKLKEKISMENVDLLEELFDMEGLLFDPHSNEDLQLMLEDATTRTISLLQQTVKELEYNVQELSMENDALKAELAAVLDLESNDAEAVEISFHWSKLSWLFSFLQFLPQLPSTIVRKGRGYSFFQSNGITQG